MYTELQIDMLQADTITALERKVITQKQFNFRINKLNKMRDDFKKEEQKLIDEMNDDLEEKEYEFISWMDEQEREEQISMSRGGYNTKTKICSKCKEELVIDMYGKNKSKADGFNWYCKECSKEYRKSYRIKNREIMNIQTKEWIENNKERAVKTAKNYYEKNKEIISKKRKPYAKQYHIDNRKHENERSRKWSINNKERHKELIAKHRENNKEYIIKQNREYGKSHLEQKRINVQKYSARKRKLPCTLTPSQWVNIKLYFNNMCCYCGKKLPLEQEHFLALTRNGEFTINNIIPACRSCNGSKNNNDFFEWYPKYKYYNKKRKEKILKYLNYKKETQQLKMF